MHAEELALVESIDSGKLLKESRLQMAAVAGQLRFCAGAADKLGGKAIQSDRPNFLIYTRREPLGVVVAIVPWNSPLSLMSFKVAPALAAGCTVVVKSAEQAPASVLAFTGSTETGIQVMQNGAAHLARVTLELGGKSANIVFDDADLEAAASGVISGIFAASGQTCVAGSRLLVHESVHDELVERIIERSERIVLGDPLDPATEMGPLAFQEQCSKVESYISLGLAEGATLASGGGRVTPAGTTWDLFIEPTVFTDVRNDMRIAREEIFGPVLVVIPFANEAEAIRIANDSPFGLAAGVWVNDGRRGVRAAHALHAGTVWINAYRTLSHQVPFGGYKASGIGRENGGDAIAAYTEEKAVWVELSGKIRDPFAMG